MTELKYKFTNDILFKMLFVKYPDLLEKLVAVLLKIQSDSIGKLEIRNPEMPPENMGDRFCRLDINMEVDGQRVDLEIQVKDEGDYPERTLFYWAREYSTALHISGKYADLPRTIIISIVGFKLFDCVEYHSEYQPLEVTRHTALSDRMVLHYYELQKLPIAVTADNDLELWLSLFKAKTEEELSKIEQLEVPEMNEAINAYRHITVTSEFREMERLRTKARHDEAQALYNAERKGRQEGRQEGIFEIARNLLMMDIPLERIIEATGLTHEEIKTLNITK